MAARPCAPAPRAAPAVAGFVAVLATETSSFNPTAVVAPVVFLALMLVYSWLLALVFLFEAWLWEHLRPLVAAVYTNRLRIGMPLQCDPTVIYALDRAGKFDGNLRRDDLRFDSPYNTYKVKGLPPTPIANPGLASMQAAAHPTRANWLYFVRKPDKVHHFFTSSYTEFQNYANAHGF